MPTSVKVSEQQLQRCLPELLDQVVKNGTECVVQRQGKDCAVIVDARQWRRRKAAERLNVLGPAYRLPAGKQARVEKLLTVNQDGSLTASQRRELQGLLRECDDILLRRARALEHIQ